MATVKIISVNHPHEEGASIPSDSLLLSKKGIVGVSPDKNAGALVKLLGKEDYKQYASNTKEKNIYGTLGEHITIEGLPLTSLKPLDTLFKDNIVLEITRVVVNDSDKIGAYARILQGGEVKAGDTLHHLGKTIRVFLIAVISPDQEANDLSPAIEQVKQSITQFMNAESREIQFEHTAIPAVPNLLERHLLKAKEFGYDLILTLGAEGIGPHDIVPDISKLHIDKEIPGIMESMRLNLMKKYPDYVLTRAIAGNMGLSLLLNLPSEKDQLIDFLEQIKQFLLQAIYILHGVKQ